MKKTAIALLALGLVAATSAFAAGPVRISKAYGGGGDSGAHYRYDFIELCNATCSTVDLTGWSIQYSSATGTLMGGTSTSSYTPLMGWIPPCGYYLIQESSGANTGAANLPVPDAIGTIAMSATSFEIALARSGTQGAPCPTTTWVDFLGVGPASCYEGAGACGALSATQYAQRRNDGETDSDGNLNDFTVTDISGAIAIHNATGGYQPECCGLGAKRATWGAIKTIYR